MRVRNCDGIGVRTLFAITRDSNLPGNFPPVFPGTTTTLARLFGRSQRHSASNPGISPPISGATRAIRHGQPRPHLPSATAPSRPVGRLSPPPFPARRRPPRAARLPGRTTSRAPSGEGPGREERSLEDRYIHTRRGSPHRKINTHHHLPGAPTTIVLRAVRVYRSGSSREGLFRALPAHSPRPGGSGVDRYTERSTE
jgi:hypothetical protein